MNVYDSFEHGLWRFPDRAALVAGCGSARHAVSFADLDRRVGKAARHLADAGLRAGDRVLVAIPFSVETFVVMLALLKSGMTVMFIDPAHGMFKIANVLRDWPPRGVIAPSRLLLVARLVPGFARISVQVASGRFVVSPADRDSGDLAQARSPAVTRAAADSALLTFTSGSTGSLKPVLRSHGFLRQQLEVLRPVARSAPGDVEFVALPMFVLFNLAQAVTSVLPACDVRHPGRVNAKIVVEQLAAESATRIIASPAFLERVSAHAGARVLPSLNCISTGGGPVSPSLPQRLLHLAPNATIRLVYGSTEAEPIAAIDHQQISVRCKQLSLGGAGLLVGAPVEGCTVRILVPGTAVDGTYYSRKQFSEISSGSDQPESIGEIVVAGKHVLKSYADATFNREHKIEVEGSIWHRTGDAGYFDTAGRLWLVGRSNAAIRDRFGVVYPFQVETVINNVDGVRRSALISHRGKRVLVLETRGSDFRAECGAAAQCIANHHIDRIVRVGRIPLDKRHDTKVDVASLKCLLDGHLARIRTASAEKLAAVLCFLHGIGRHWHRGFSRFSGAHTQSDASASLSSRSGPVAGDTEIDNSRHS